MYYPIGLPKKLKICNEDLIQCITCNRDRNLFCILLLKTIWIWNHRPCLPLNGIRRSKRDVDDNGINCLIEWRPDSSLFVVATDKSKLLFYSIIWTEKNKEIYFQTDSPNPGLKRDSAELYYKDKLMSLAIKLRSSRENMHTAAVHGILTLSCARTSWTAAVHCASFSLQGINVARPTLVILPSCWIPAVRRVDISSSISCLVCLRDELMVGCLDGHIQRLRWNGSLNYDYCIDLTRVPFCDDQLVMQALPLPKGVCVVCLEYSPLVGGFATVLSDGRAAYLTATTLQFDPNAVQGIWAKELDNATCAAINHKYRLLAYGCANGEGVVYQVDEATGGLEVTHKLALSSRDFAGDPGSVCYMKWSPDGTVLALCWSGGGFSLWSVFGSLITVSLKWDYSDHPRSKPVAISCMEWAAEGYALWCVQVCRLVPGQTQRSEGLPMSSGCKTACLLNYNASKSVSRSSKAYYSTNILASHLNNLSVNNRYDIAGDQLAKITTNLLQFNFLKSSLTVNPSMSRLQRILLQGSNSLYIGTHEEMPATLFSHLSNEMLRSCSSPAYILDESNSIFSEPCSMPPTCHCQTSYTAPPSMCQCDRKDVAEQSLIAANSCSKQWLVVPIPHTYIAANYPIRYVSADGLCSVLSVAGRNGVAHYSVRHRRWHLFGNETQEEDFVVTGGMVWWHSSYLVLGTYNIQTNTDELRLYPQCQKLDDQFCTVVRQPTQVLLLNIYDNHLAVLTADCHITVYYLNSSVNEGKDSFGVVVQRVQEVDISGLAVHPACVVSIALTSLRTESPKLPKHLTSAQLLQQHHTNYYNFDASFNKSLSRSSLTNDQNYFDQYMKDRYLCSPHGNEEPFLKHRTQQRAESLLRLPPAQSLIFNISGKVLMIQRDHVPETGSRNEPLQGGDSNGKLFQHAQMTPIVLASCCENLWCFDFCNSSHKPHLSHALWLHCGAQGTRAWLPLFPNTADQSHTFLARRIMLPVVPSIYPLVVMFEEGLLLGAETDSSLLGSDSSSFHQPHTVVTRTSQVYLQDVLRQLLRRNLGYHAWEVASTCQTLPHFPHALELLLHQVLEEEATSKEPLPDTLLPRVLDFIREFPSLALQTIVRCARKTELLHWRLLFSVAGCPSSLFTEALQAGQLDTAASYLIILQNLESVSVSRNHATRLLDETLEACRWQLCKDLIRFLSSIDPSDMDSPRQSQQHSGAIVTSSTKVGFSHATQPVSPACVDEDLAMILPNTQALRVRTFSSTSATKGVNISPGTASNEGAAAPQLNTSNNSASGSAVKGNFSRYNSRSSDKSLLLRKRSNSSGCGNADVYFVDIILQRHAKKLLLGKRLRDLGTMTARLDFPVVSWLRRERCRAARLDDFVAAVCKIHQDFAWPYPTNAATSVRRLSLSSSSLAATDFSPISEFGECKLKELSLSTSKAFTLAPGRMGDSGYLSQATATGETQSTPQHGTNAVLATTTDFKQACYGAGHLFSDLGNASQAVLLPHSFNTGEHRSEEESSVVGSACASLDYSFIDPTRDLLARSPDPLPDTVPYAQVQLRYLLQVFMEADCLEWSTVISVVLRDALAVVRAVNAAADASLPVLLRLLQGLNALNLFSHTHCMGYQNFMMAIHPQIRVLENLIETRQESSKSRSKSMQSSSRSLHLSPDSSAGSDSSKPGKMSGIQRSASDPASLITGLGKQSTASHSRCSSISEQSSAGFYSFDEVANGKTHQKSEQLNVSNRSTENVNKSNASEHSACVVQ